MQLPPPPISRLRTNAGRSSLVVGYVGLLSSLGVAGLNFLAPGPFNIGIFLTSVLASVAFMVAGSSLLGRIAEIPMALVGVAAQASLTVGGVSLVACGIFRRDLFLSDYGLRAAILAIGGSIGVAVLRRSKRAQS